MWSISLMSSIWLQLRSRLTNEYSLDRPSSSRILFCDKFRLTKFPSCRCQSRHSAIRLQRKLSACRLFKWLRWAILSIWFLSNTRSFKLGNNRIEWSISSSWFSLKTACRRFFHTWKIKWKCAIPISRTRTWRGEGFLIMKVCQSIGFGNIVYEK